MGSLEVSSEEAPRRTDYEVVSELRAEARIELNLAVLDGQEPPDEELVKTVEYWSKEASKLARAANEVIFQ